MNRKLVVGALKSIFIIAMVQSCAAQSTCPQPRLISVVGTAEIMATPDEAVVSFGVESRDKVLTVAKSQNDARVKKVMTLTRASGVEQKDIKTSTLRMGPEYSDEKIPRLLGYDVSQTIAITLKDLSKYEGLMTQLLEAGVNRVDGLNFRLSELRKYRDDARSKAIAAAKEKATAMATDLGQTIGKPWAITEEGGEAEVANFVEAFWQRRSNAELGGSTVAPGQVTVRSSVRVSFQLE